MAHSSDEVSEKVQRIIEDGDDPDILKNGYERQRALRMLRDHAEHPHSPETVVERATDAIDQLTSGPTAPHE